MTKIVLELTTALSNDDLNLTELEIGGKILDFHGEVEEAVNNIVTQLKRDLNGDMHNVVTNIVPGDIHFTITVTFNTSTDTDFTDLLQDLLSDFGYIIVQVYGEEAVGYGIEPEEIAKYVYGNPDAVRNYEMIADTLITMFIELKHIKTTVGTQSNVRC